MDASAPFESLYDLGTLSEAGYERVVTASPAELVRLAAWEGVDSVKRFEGHVTLKKLSRNRFAYRAELTADVVQSCVVTLDPVLSHIVRTFARDLHYMARRLGEEGGEVTLTAGEDDAPEEIDSLRFDLAAPLIEEFSLAVDPYPRALGVEFEPPDDTVSKRESPFAALKPLKRG